MNQGKGAAWQRLGNLNNDLSDIITEQEKLNNAHEKKKQDALDKAEKERKAKADKRNKELTGITTGRKTRYLNFEHALTNAFRKEGGVIDKFAEAQRRLEIDPNDSEAVAIKANIKREVDRLAKIKNAMIGYNTKLAEGIANGTLSKKLNQGFLTNMQKINDGEVEFEVDEYGGIKIKNLGKPIDLDGDGFPDEITLESIADKNNFGVWEKDFDLNTFNTGLKKQFGVKHTKNDDGTFTTVEEKGYNLAYASDVKDKYKEVFGKDANSLTNQGKSYIYQLGLTPKQVRENPALYDEIINKAELGFRNMFDNQKFETTDHSAINQRKRIGLGYYKARKDEAPQQEFELMTNNSDSGGQKPVIEENSKGEKVYAFTPPLDKKGKPRVAVLGSREIEIQKIGITDKGELSFTGTGFQKTTEKDGTITRRETARGEIKGLSADEMNIISRLYGYKNANEMANSLTNKKNNQLGGNYSLKNKDLDSGFVEKREQQKIAKIYGKIGEFFSDKNGNQKTTMKSHKIVPYLKSLGLKGFEDIGFKDAFNHNVVKFPNGTEVNVNTKAGFKQLLDYLDENLNDLVLQKGKEQNSTGKQKSLRTKYNY